MKTSWRSASLVASAAAVLVLTTACGQEKADTSTGTQNVGAAPAAGGYGAAASPSTGTAAEGQGTVAQSAGQLAVADTDKLGEVVTDSAGMTLYRFDKDTAEPPKSTCDGDCATAWPPVPASGAAAP